jgi:hypothetical protein
MTRIKSLLQVVISVDDNLILIDWIDIKMHAKELSKLKLNRKNLLRKISKILKMQNGKNNMKNS